MKKDFIVNKINSLLKTAVVVLTLVLLLSVEQVSGSMFLYMKAGNNSGGKRVMALLNVFPLYQYTFDDLPKTSVEKSNMLNIISKAQISMLQTENITVSQAIPVYQDYFEEQTSLMAETEGTATGMEKPLTEDAMIDEPLMGGTLTDEPAENKQVEEIPDADETVPVFSPNIIRADAKAVEYDLTQFGDFNVFLKEFYAVDSSTSVTQNKLNIDELASMDLHVKPGGENPQILIYHTHSQEGFADSVPGDMSTTVVGAGEKLSELLKEYGYNVLHHTGQYDVKRRDDAYYYAAPALEEILKTYPSIEVIIDLHRDEVKEGTKLVTEIDGKPCAKFMFFNGLSYNNTLGEISYLPNENLKENLAFSFQAQVNANEYYPGLTRRIYLRGYRYNMQYRGKSMLVELGAQTNTVEEAMNAVEPLAHVIAVTLLGED